MRVLVLGAFSRGRIAPVGGHGFFRLRLRRRTWDRQRQVQYHAEQGIDPRRLACYHFQIESFILISIGTFLSASVSVPIRDRPVSQFLPLRRMARQKPNLLSYTVTSTLENMQGGYDFSPRKSDWIAWEGKVSSCSMSEQRGESHVEGLKMKREKRMRKERK